jgi:hypothetical protein
MTRSQRRTILGLLLATFLLMAPAVSAAPPGAVAPRTALAQLWSFLAGLWPPASPDDGCSDDPDGSGCHGGIAATAGADGCTFDPNGSCRGGSATTAGDNGCSYDPDGSCRVGG